MKKLIIVLFLLVLLNYFQENSVSQLNKDLKYILKLPRAQAEDSAPCGGGDPNHLFRNWSGE
jgi:hypothetical protein